MKYLITFGCSWAWGAGVGYRAGMAPNDFKNIVWDQEHADKDSFRGQLALEFGYENINFSIWKSSNKKQFRLARNFFNSDKFQDIKRDAEDIIILWGLTATGRGELFSVKHSDFVSFALNNKHESDETGKTMSDFFLRYNYDHDHEVSELTEEIKHWNNYFNMLGIKNYWYDSFNHHNYDIDTNNFVIDHDTSRDLMSQLVLSEGFSDFDSSYHTSMFVNDTNRIDFLIGKGLINPYSFHPTKRGHEKIASMMKYVFDRSKK